MTPNELAAYEAEWNTVIAAQNAAWIAKFGLPEVDPATVVRMAAKFKEWAEFLQAKAAAAAWEAEWDAAKEQPEGATNWRANLRRSQNEN
jgi:hypothetical protein